jgi:predicted enzyme related to lactoylglutathione lyase
VQLPVRNLEAALAFYRDRLGHELVWRTDTSAGLRLPETDAELVLQAERPNSEVDLLVESVEKAVKRWTDAGGSVVVAPFDIAIGRCAVVADPFDNRVVLLDTSKGSVKTPLVARPSRPPAPAPEAPVEPSVDAQPEATGVAPVDPLVPKAG